MFSDICVRKGSLERWCSLLSDDDDSQSHDKIDEGETLTFNLWHKPA